MRHVREFFNGHVRMEADDAVVRRMDAHEGDRALADGVFVVLRVDAVGASDLAQGGSAAFHDVRNAEAASDFHKLPPGDHDFAAGTERVHRDQNGGGIVVDHKGGLGSRKRAEQFLNVAVAAAAFPCGKVQLKVGVPPASLEDGVHGLVREDGAAHIGMDDDPGGVEHAAEARCGLFFREGGEPGEQGVQAELSGIRKASFLDVSAAAVQKGVGERPEQWAGRRCVQYGRGVFQSAQAGVDRRQGAKEVVHVFSCEKCGRMRPL